jgi:hypothetical protein
MTNHDGRNRWLSADGLGVPAIGQQVILRRLVTRDGHDVARYLTPTDGRTDDHVTGGPNTSIYDGCRMIVDVRRNKDGAVTAVQIDSY